MFELLLFFLLAIPIMLLFCIGVPLIIGIVVYRDANKRVDCSPWLWALVAALAPSFIGLIIYLIIRNDYPLKSMHRSQSQQSQQSQQEQSADGEYEQEYYQQQAAKKGLPTWAKVLIITGVVILAISLFAGLGIAIYNFFAYNTGFGYHYGF